MTTRRNLLLGASGLVLLAALPALAQRRDRPARIGTLDDSHEGSRAREWQAFRKRLQELGYAEGPGYLIESRWAKGQADQLPALAAELVALKPDVIVTAGTIAALAAKRASSSVPIVCLLGTDPIRAGLIKSLVRPEGNLTGISILTTDMVGKWLELVREIVPRAKSIAFLTYSDNSGTMNSFRELQERAKPLGIAVQALDGRNRSNVERAFETMAREHVDAFVVPAAAVILDQRVQIVEAAARQRIAAVYGRREYVDSGGLMSYGADYNTIFPRAADYVHRILQGAKPSELPFQRASTFRLVVNANAAKALGLKIPESVRVRVDEVIQ
jgi:putative ABC transport system substrate-binding protein